MAIFVTDDHRPLPCGRELTGYETPNFERPLEKTKGRDAIILVKPFISDERQSAIVQFPGGYIAEIHSSAQ